MVGFFIQRSLRSAASYEGGSTPSLGLGIIAFLSTCMLFSLTNPTTEILIQKEVRMSKQFLVPVLMFISGVAINLFSSSVGLVAQT